MPQEDTSTRRLESLYRRLDGGADRADRGGGGASGGDWTDRSRSGSGLQRFDTTPLARMQQNHQQQRRQQPMTVVYGAADEGGGADTGRRRSGDSADDYRCPDTRDDRQDDSGGGGTGDFVQREAYNELSALCRELLAEQKVLRAQLREQSETLRRFQAGDGSTASTPEVPGLQQRPERRVNAGASVGDDDGGGFARNAGAGSVSAAGGTGRQRQPQYAASVRGRGGASTGGAAKGRTAQLGGGGSINQRGISSQPRSGGGNGGGTGKPGAAFGSSVRTGRFDT
ncbi:unnamed protein product [Phaeothamnion confervicola]